MEQKIIINTPLPSEDGTTDWFSSMLTAQGVEKDGYLLNSTYTQIKASDLPEEYMPALMGVVQHLIAVGEDDGGKRCVVVEACLMEIPALVAEGDDGEPVEVESAREAVKLDITWQWSDGRVTASDVTLEAAVVIDLVKFLLTETTYQKS